MVAGVVLLVVLSNAPPSVEVRGEAPPIEERRGRVRGSLAFAPAFSLLSWEGELALGPGAFFEAGLIFNDRLALNLHLESTLLLPSSTDFKPRGLAMLGGLRLDWFFDDRWSVGAGVLGGAFVGTGAAAFMLPLRVSWRVSARDSRARERAGVMLGVQAGPGLQAGSYARPSSVTFIGSGLLTVGVGWW